MDIIMETKNPFGLKHKSSKNQLKTGESNCNFEGQTSFAKPLSGLAVNI
jgi:hypothetical protein